MNEWICLWKKKKSISHKRTNEKLCEEGSYELFSINQQQLSLCLHNDPTSKIEVVKNQKQIYWE